MNPPANGTDQIYAIACSLLSEWLAANPGTKIRLLGVGAPAVSECMYDSMTTALHFVGWMAVQ